MILTGPAIRAEVATGRIIIEPFNEAQLNPNSYNYRLGNEIVELTDQVIDARAPQQAVRHPIPASGWQLNPGRLYLAHTEEVLGSDHYVVSLIGRSTMGRLGLWLQVSADMGNLGTRHRWTLELKVVQPLIIYPGMLIGQVSFWQPQGEHPLYAGKYAEQTSAEPSRVLREFWDQS